MEWPWEWLLQVHTSHRYHMCFSDTCSSSHSPPVAAFAAPGSAPLLATFLTAPTPPRVHFQDPWHTQRWAQYCCSVSNGLQLEYLAQAHPDCVMTPGVSPSSMCITPRGELDIIVQCPMAYNSKILLRLTQTMWQLWEHLPHVRALHWHWIHFTDACSLTHSPCAVHPSPGPSPPCHLPHHPHTSMCTFSRPWGYPEVSTVSFYYYGYTKTHPFSSFPALPWTHSTCATHALWHVDVQQSVNQIAMGLRHVYKIFYCNLAMKYIYNALHPPWAKWFSLQLAIKSKTLQNFLKLP